MQKYKSHKTVEAGKILNIQKPYHDSIDIEFTVEHEGGGGEQHVMVNEPRFARAKVGDYLVKYRNVDGSDYFSVSPAPEFEAGYTKVSSEGGPVFHIFRDGDQWCAIDHATFGCLADSKAGYGDNPENALAELLKA